MEKIANHINGTFVPPISGVYFENPEPATGRPLSLVPDSDERDVDQAVDAARRAFGNWSTVPADGRARVLMRIADIVERNLAELAALESADNGKTVALAHDLDVPRAVANFRFFASSIIAFHSESHGMEGRALNYTLRKPIGVVGAISPWNLPLYLLTWKIAPALAAGNCVVAKPSELTPMTAHRLAGICSEAGLPPGVLNIVHGYGQKVGRAVSAHPQIPAITFTGGTRTGRDITERAAPHFKTLSLEMGGRTRSLYLRILGTRSTRRCFVQRSAHRSQIRERSVSVVRVCLLNDPCMRDSAGISSHPHPLFGSVTRTSRGRISGPSIQKHISRRFSPLSTSHNRKAERSSAAESGWPFRDDAPAAGLSARR